MDFLADEKSGCHRTGFEQKCRDLVFAGTCRRWIQIQGKNPNTGQDLNEWNCVDNVMPWLAIENSMIQRQTGASVDKVATQVAALAGQVATLAADIGHLRATLLLASDAAMQGMANAQRASRMLELPGQ